MLELFQKVELLRFSQEDFSKAAPEINQERKHGEEVLTPIRQLMWDADSLLKLPDTVCSSTVQLISGSFL